MINLKGVPHPLTGDYTPKPQQEIDESLYVYGKKGPQKHKTSISDGQFNKYSTCQSNDSARSFGNTSEHSVEFESEIIRVNVNSVRENVNSVRQNVNSVRSNVNIVRPIQPVPTSNSTSFSPGNWGTVVKTSAGYNWRNTIPNSNCNNGSNFVRTVNAKGYPLMNMEDRGIFDSRYSGHMTGNKDHLDNFEECKRGSVTFGGSKGYITGKGRIRVGNLEKRLPSKVFRNESCGLPAKKMPNSIERRYGVDDRMNRDPNVRQAHELSVTDFMKLVIPVLVRTHITNLLKQQEDEAEELYCVLVVVRSITASKCFLDQGCLLLISRQEEFFVRASKPLKHKKRRLIPTGISEDTP
ncbi:hypothetical protein Tco_0369197 [Tanacetum coccineum]